MKRKLLPFLLSFCFLSLIYSIKSDAQGTATTNVYYGGFQACGGCAVCGADYWCYNTLGSYCGDTGPCGTATFWDPVPAGNIVTNITLNVWTGGCSGGDINLEVNSNVFPTSYDSNVGCLCSDQPCFMTTSTTATYPCGISDYNYGSSAPNSLDICTGEAVCMQRVEIVCTYAPADQSTPPQAPGVMTGSSVLCAGNTDNYSISTVTGAASYNWTVPPGWTINSGQGTTSISVTGASGSGNICVTPTNLCGTSGPACMAVSGAAPSATTANNGPVCEATTLTLTGGTSGMTTYSWSGPNSFSSSSQSPTVSSSATPVMSGTYTLTVTIGGCTSTSSTIVTVNALPAAEAGTDPGSVTCTNPSLSLNGSGGGSYSWTASGGGNITSGANTATPVINSGGTYTLTVTDGNGCSASDNIIVNQNITVPTADAGVAPGQISCTSTSLTLSASGGGNYSWSASGGGNIVSGANTATPTINAGGTYTVTVTDPTSGCTASDNVVITQDPTAPVADAGTSPGSITCTTTSLILSGTGGGSYSWSASGGGNITSGANTATPIINAGGTYTVTVTVGACTAADNVVISENITPPIADAGTSPGIITCSVTSLILSASGGGTYAWSASGGGNIVSGGNTAAPTIDAGGTYTVTVTDAVNGCTASDEVIITENTTPPIANAGPDVNVCEGTSTTLSASGGNLYSWSPTSTLDDPNIAGPVASPTSPTTYIVTVTDVNGCSATDDVYVGYSPPLTPVIDPSGQTGFCDSASVSVTLDAGSGYTSYLWSTGETTQTIYVNQPGTYDVSVGDANGCTGSSGTVTVYVQPPNINPVILAASASSFCKGDSVNLYLIDPYYTYEWSSGSNTPTIWVFETNNYVVTVTDSLGCVGVSDPYHVQVSPMPVAYASYANQMLDVSFFDFSANTTSWFWDFGDGQSSTLSDPMHLYDTSDVYIVILTATNGCGSDDDTLYIDLPGAAGIEDVNANMSDIQVYPVPVFDYVYVSFDITEPSNIEIMVTDILGQKLFFDDLKGFDGNYSVRINMSEYADGIYMLSVMTDDEIVIRKLSKE